MRRHRTACEALARNKRTFTKGWRMLHNFADGSCGIYACLQACLIVQGVRPRHAETAFTGKKTSAVRHLVRLCRAATVGASGPTNYPGTSDIEDQNPTKLGKWEEAILDVGGEDDAASGWYDEKAILLLLGCLGLRSRVQLVVKTDIHEDSYSTYTDVGGSSTPIYAQVLIEWIGGCHFGVVVHNVRV